MPRVLIFGTGTGVGKTYVTAALARALRASGAEVRARKPIETGVPLRKRFFHVKQVTPPKGTDARALAEASSHPAAGAHPLYAFVTPISAHLAARREHKRISLPALRAWADHDWPDTTRHYMSWHLIETAGGVFSPLSARTTNLDLVAALAPDIVVLVAHDGLGVLHDVRATLLGLEAVGARRPDHLILSRSRTADASTGTNAAELPRLGLPRPTAVVGEKKPERDLAPLVRALLRAAR